ncbi:uncharacterized protein PADG_00680 [Paracoccidioides brasiliensis Pb18]|uniref:DUF7918 domain-containing protein n=2 Tax=Paracoccidioides brasiliensis TaxID=121759 RepID=C1G1E0_PARBD|nr:uncharacterized protein PADG_00680 [Paracoccidioides brasiliensis Pb18]EEH44391.1 hypothetical protein PADG_00680 [Paracoccidioides brasiliensis Pb18]ODH14996.1 hypothetical protein ACO22_06480 [Paracoccidioides brasiliensis]ODH53557.1 hypothetical protein GX48_00390 [Paracoccidioides brasiliensis]
MPCFKGLAVSIHTPNGPLPEYSVQRQSRASRIACYIPVPPPKLPDSSASKPEQSTFAISITLLTPGQNVPYSTPKPTPENPHPKAKVVGPFPKGANTVANSVGPYQALTTSPNETVAAYIYFDGRQKEEVATLLRRGEETWVNSRWVGIPQSEGGGLAEREFLFREVGLERWLNGLDLEGKDSAAKIERRWQKMERRRRRKGSNSTRRQGQEEQRLGNDGNDEMMEMDEKKTRFPGQQRQSVLRYGDDAEAPVENLSDVDYTSGTEDDDDDPIPETAGQIKVTLFRVLASGEIKRGEYSPQFDAHDDDEDKPESNGQGANDVDVDHTTSFAKPKSLDPRSISTQTVTGIDPPDRPYAIFTFMYRGERQLQKMGILETKSKAKDNTGSTAKRVSVQPDFANLAPLKPGGAVGFINFRDSNSKEGLGKSRKKPKRSSGSDMDDSDDDDENGTSSILHKAEYEEDKDVGSSLLSPDDVKRQGELAEGVRQIKLKRQHSADPLTNSGNATSLTSKSNTPAPISTTPPSNSITSTTTVAVPDATTPPHGASSLPDSHEPHINNHSSSVLDRDPAFIGSPLKKQRASVLGTDNGVFNNKRSGGSCLAANIQEITGSSPSSGLNGCENGNVATSVLPGSNLSIKQKPPQEPEEDL